MDSHLCPVKTPPSSVTPLNESARSENSFLVLSTHQDSEKPRPPGLKSHRGKTRHTRPEVTKSQRVPSSSPSSTIQVGTMTTPITPKTPVLLRLSYFTSPVVVEGVSRRHSCRTVTHVFTVVSRVHGLFRSTVGWKGKGRVVGDSRTFDSKDLPSPQWGYLPWTGHRYPLQSPRGGRGVSGKEVVEERVTSLTTPLVAKAVEEVGETL